MALDNGIQILTSVPLSKQIQYVFWYMYECWPYPRHSETEKMAIWLQKNVHTAAYIVIWKMGNHIVMHCEVITKTILGSHGVSYIPYAKFVKTNFIFWDMWTDD